MHAGDELALRLAAPVGVVSDHLWVEGHNLGEWEGTGRVERSFRSGGRSGPSWGPTSCMMSWRMVFASSSVSSNSKTNGAVQVGSSDGSCREAK